MENLRDFSFGCQSCGNIKTDDCEQKYEATASVTISFDACSDKEAKEVVSDLFKDSGLCIDSLGPITLKKVIKIEEEVKIDG